MRKNEEYTVVGGRCKQTMYIHRHRVIKVEGKGYRCKWCGKPVATLRKEMREA